MARSIMSSPHENSVPSTQSSLEAFHDLNERNNVIVKKVSEFSSNLHDDDDEYDASSMISATSTIEYNQESYSTFQHKARQLMMDLSPGYTTNCIDLERMQGGAFNRIVGIRMSKPQSKLPWYVIGNLRTMLSACVRGKTKQAPKSKDLILRIPRDTVHNLYYQTATLAYLERKLPYPVPKTIFYDSSTNNALGQAYILQKRLSGKPLSQLWATLTPEQRISAAQCIAEIVRDLHTIRNPCAGIISPRNTPYDLDRDVLKLEPIPMPGTLAATSAYPMNNLASSQTTRDLLLSLVSRQRQHAEDTDNPVFETIWRRFTAMIHKLHALGHLPDKDGFYLYHPDLQSRNLLFTTPTPSAVRLTGILDWDTAVFAPRFMSTRAPYFLWTGDDADEYEEGDALLEPEDAEMKTYKSIFENAVGAEFVKDAYRPEYVLARGMWRFLVSGINSGSELFEAEEVLEKWEEMYPVEG
jgi:aminoglycoside phosphotransferase (APT) family kinase protein